MTFSPTKPTQRIMVAETLPQSRPPRRKGIQSRIPLTQKLHVRSLYIIQQLPVKEIADKSGLSPDQIRNLITRENWKASKDRAKAQLQDRADARIQAECEEVVNAVATQTADLSVSTLTRARATLDRKDPNAARDLQAYSQAAKNFVGIYRQARELDAIQQDQRGQTTVVFLGDLPRVSRQSGPINVTPQQPIPAIPMPLAAPPSVSEGQDTGQQAMD